MKQKKPKICAFFQYPMRNSETGRVFQVSLAPAPICVYVLNQLSNQANHPYIVKLIYLIYNDRWDHVCVG